MTLLHCNTEYPTPYEDANLLAMLDLAGQFGVEVGLSDHTAGWECDVAAAALGAAVIEKHFTLDKTMEGRTTRPAWTWGAAGDDRRGAPHRGGAGHRQKAVSGSEAKNKPIARKSIVAARAIQKGEAFTAENLTTKRPGGG